MSESVYSFVFDRGEALKAFPQTGKYDLILGVLASMPPEAEWEGCVVYEGKSPMEGLQTVCIGIEGALADQVQEKLVEGFEQRGVPVLRVYEGGPEIQDVYAKVENQTWVAAK